MANELKHKVVGSNLSQTEWEDVDTHVADGQTTNDILYFNGTTWIRATLADYLASQKNIILPNDGVLQLGTEVGATQIKDGRGAGDPHIEIQPKAGNHKGEIILRPSGTSTDSVISLNNASDYDNKGMFMIYIAGLLAYLMPNSLGGGDAPTDLRIGFDTSPSTTGLDYGLGNASYWWKHVKAQGIHAISSFSDHTWSGNVTVDVTAGQNLVFGDAVYMKSDGKAWKSDADATATMPIFGIAIATINTDATGEILTQGWIRDDSWSLTAGGIVYASVTPGAISTTAPVGSGDQVQVVGIAKTTTLIHFNPSYELTEVT